MAENNRTQDQNITGGKHGNRGTSHSDQSSQTGAEKNVQEQNPQDGKQWNNYRSREMSDEGGGAGNATTPKTNR